MEEKLAKARVDMIAFLERNSELQKELARIKIEIEKALKQTTSSQVITNLTSKGSNRRRGLGYHYSNAPSNPYYKYVNGKYNLLCIHYGKNSHTRELHSFRITPVRSMRNFLVLRGKRDSLPGWTKKKLIFPFSPFQELKLKWISKTSN